MRFALIALLLLSLSSAPAAASECVVLLHGLARTESSMDKLGQRLVAMGYQISNLGYPSRQFPIEVLAAQAVDAGVKRCRQQDAATVHFVTHSLGGILVRYYLSQHALPDLGRVVMLAPPNQGSEVVDALADMPGFIWLNGPAGAQLGTGPESVPLALGPADFELGVIAGSRSINLFLSHYLPNPDDGKVSVASTRLEGMRDFLVLPVSHPFVMKDDEAIRQTLYFLANGQFAR